MVAELPGHTLVHRLDRPADGGPYDGGGRRASVYLAVRPGWGDEVAVRLYDRPVRDERDRSRFQAEVTALRALNGEPHILPIIDAGVSPYGQAYLVTEFCPAGSLRDHLLSVGRLTPAEVRRIGAKLAGALVAAHRRRLYHRDLRPSAVLLDAAGEPRITAFALVSLATVGRNYAPPDARGAGPYRAPEAYLPELMSEPADIFALGATLYALLAGADPRPGDPSAAAVDGDTVVDLPAVPWALMDIVRRAMAHDPAARYPDAAQLRAVLIGR